MRRWGWKRQKENALFKVRRVVERDNIRANKRAGKKQLRIGVMGAAKGIGTTHLALMLACYCSGGCGLKTAIIESGKNDYMKICGETSTKAEDIRHFTYKHIDFNSCRTQKEIADCLSKSYEAVIMDLYSGALGALEEFKRCDVRIVVVATAVWKMEEVRQTMERLKDVDCITAVFMPDYKRLRRRKELSHMVVFDIPAEADPLCITSETMFRLEEFFSRQCR